MIRNQAFIEPGVRPSGVISNFRLTKRVLGRVFVRVRALVYVYPAPGGATTAIKPEPQTKIVPETYKLNHNYGKIIS